MVTQRYRRCRVNFRQRRPVRDEWGLAVGDFNVGVRGFVPGGEECADVFRATISARERAFGAWVKMRMPQVPAVFRLLGNPQVASQCSMSSSWVAE